MRLHIILTCHNRRASTLSAIAGAVRAATRANLAIDFTVVDDGSTDGTSMEIKERFPDVKVVNGDGSLYWAGGMALAEAHAMECRDAFDWLVWLNDDVVLDDDVFERATSHLNANPRSVLIGAMHEPGSSVVSYTGFVRTGLHPLRFRQVLPSADLQAVDTFNGNLVFISSAAASLVGSIDGHFSHALADLDYGLRCGAEGVPVLLLPGTSGSCARNPVTREERFLDRWQAFSGVKGGGNRASIARFTRRHARFTWPAYFAGTYFVWLMKDLGHALPRFAQRKARAEGGRKQ